MKKFDLMEKIGAGIALLGLAITLGVLMYMRFTIGCVILGFVMFIIGVAITVNSKD